MPTKYAAISLAAGLFLLAVKFFAYSITGSNAILSDALESIVNVTAASVALFVVRLSKKPADADHPYGHGKAEYFSATFEGGLITFAGIAIILESIRDFGSKNALQEIDSGLWLTIGAGLVNGVLGLTLKSIGKEHKSDALVASGIHLLSDLITTVGVTVGLILVKLTGIIAFDSITAIVVASYLIYSGYKVIRSSSSALMDAEDPESVSELKKIIEKYAYPGIIRIHALRVMRSGHYHHIDAHVVVPEFWDVQKTHNETNKYENKVIKEYSYDGEVHFHVDPCRRVYCEMCDLPNCQVRTKEFKGKPPLTVDELTSPVEPL
ncbi:MAG: cation transporter [Bdellovibrionales bacterium]|nr:cation transporter [Bdellovibrionales bacterium]